MRGVSEPGSGAPISFILALVFPAIIAAALALAYYGFKHAEDVSRPVEQLFRQESRDFAEDLARAVETRMDRESQHLFDELAEIGPDKPLADLCEVDPGPSMDSFIVLNAAKKVECAWPSVHEAGRHRDVRVPWLPKIKNLPWAGLEMDRYAYHHDLLDGNGSILLVYTARRTADVPPQPYFVVGSIKVSVIAKQWLEEELTRRRKNRRVEVVGPDNELVAGAPLGPEARPGGRFYYEGPFGKALYRWRILMVPQNVESFRAQWEQTKNMRRLLIILSTIIIAVGLAVVWLTVVAERRASRLKSDFIANVSHELKTPLSLIRMFGELVATGKHKGEDTAREYGAIITRESERLAHLIDNVLDFARLERGKASYHFSEGYLAEVVERALDVCRYRLEKEKLKLQTTIDPELPVVRMDENGMTLVTLNLVDNAIKHAGQGGTVQVSVTREPGFIVLGVRDFGPGVPASEQARIFDRFYRAQRTREANVRGSGIGLALVKHIVEAHGGRVSVTSPVPETEGPSGGALFRVFLPAPVPADGAPAGAIAS